jgi:ankyrin repeat protein
LAKLQKELIEAVSKDGDKEVKRILNDPDAKELPQAQIVDENGSGVLQIAASRACEPVVKSLIEGKIAINAVDKRDGTALQAAILSNKSDDSIQPVVDTLIEAKGSDINARGGLYGSALQAACYRYLTRKETVQKLLKLNAEVNTKGGQYGNAFEAACVAGDEQLLLQLVEKLRDVDMVSKIHGTPLQAAACIGRGSVVAALIKRKANVGFVGGFYGTALQAAAKGSKQTARGKEAVA